MDFVSTLMQLDKDSDGKLSLQELAATDDEGLIWSDVEDDFRKAIKASDKDGDMLLSEEEWPAFIQTMQADSEDESSEA